MILGAQPGGIGAELGATEPGAVATGSTPTPTPIIVAKAGLVSPHPAAGLVSPHPVYATDSPAE